MIRQNRIRLFVLDLLAPLMGRMFLLGGLRRRSFFQPLGLAPLHRGVMRMRLFVVLTARTAEKEENFLRIGTAHASSLRR